MRTMCLLALGIGVIGLLFVGARWCGRLEQPDLYQRAIGVDESRPSDAELEARLADIHRSSFAKRQVAQDVLAQRLTLLEAAACFREASANLPEVLKRLHFFCPGASDRPETSVGELG
jgi:hypothetical protein